MWYLTLKRFVSIFFNILNRLMGGNLPPFTCACVIVEDAGKYLILKRPQGQIVFPGGFMRWREQPVHTAQREGREETGLQLTIGDFIGYYFCASSNIRTMSTLTLTYHGKVTGGKLRTGLEGEPAWVDESFLREKMSFYYLLMLDDYLKYTQQRNRADDFSLSRDLCP